MVRSPRQIYNSRNYSILLNIAIPTMPAQSTTVEIILYYLTMSNDTLSRRSTTVEIILYYLTRNLFTDIDLIYNSRNYSILLNFIISVIEAISTTVEIILYYLTWRFARPWILSTTVEIILYYLTLMPIADIILSTTVEIILYYLTLQFWYLQFFNT